jgi:hypothetical protein
MESSTEVGWELQLKYGGRYLPPSITIHPIDNGGDVALIRTIAGPSTSLSWPMGIHMDSKSDEIVVANNGDDSVVSSTGLRMVMPHQQGLSVAKRPV